MALTLNDPGPGCICSERGRHRSGQCGDGCFCRRCACTCGLGCRLGRALDSDHAGCSCGCVLGG